MYEYMTYEKAEKKYGLKNHTRRCIDGKITGCGNCVGYCMYSEHSGFLTKNLRTEHDCLGKQCRHYVEKRVAKQEDYYNPFATVITSYKNKVDDAFSMACSLTKDYEGMRFLKANLINDFVCELCYVTISNEYELNSIADLIEEKTGIKIKTKRLNYSFDNTVSIIMEKAYA